MEDGGGAGFTRHRTGILLIGYLPFLVYTTSSIWAYSHLQKGPDMEQPFGGFSPLLLELTI